MIDNNKENSEYILDEDEFEEDQPELVFKQEIKKDEEEDDTEIPPQEEESYRAQSKLIDEPTEGLTPVAIHDEVETSFLDYAMSVLVSRAIPDARDGLKPVHRRILYDMSELGMTPGTQYKKSARIVGDVLGKYHPHGDSSVYNAMVRLAQDFSMRYPLVDGHGNFGSIDGDEPASMRYTEARMAKISTELLEGIKKNTVDFVDNYDSTEKEPAVLPSRFPNLLVSGSIGIAVGMATSIPPHNLKETIDAVIAYARNKDITVEELLQYIKGPDFPTGGVILGTKGILEAYKTGRGQIPVRSEYEIVQLKNEKFRIIITKIPYNIRKSAIVESISKLDKENAVEGISDLRDESNRDGIRIVIDIKKGFNPEVVLNKLFKKSSLLTKFNVNMVALVNTQPKLLTLKDVLDVYLEHQKEVLTRELNFDLKKAQDSIHILEGLLVATNNIDDVVALIKSSSSDEVASKKLIEKYSLSEEQAKAILNMRLGRLTGLSYSKMTNEIEELRKEIQRITSILDSEQELVNNVIADLEKIKEKYGDSRKTSIDASASSSIDEEQLIPRKDIVITATVDGFVKRVNLEEYNLQNRGGMGSTGMKTWSGDAILSIIQTNTHVDLFLFSNLGKVYKLRAYKIQEADKKSKGNSFANLVELNKELNEKIIKILPVDSYESNLHLLTVTKKGIVKKTALDNFKKVRSNGIKAFKLKDEEDELKDVILVTDSDLVLVANNHKNVVKFEASKIRSQARNSIGVQGMKLDGKYEVQSISSSKEGEFVLTIGEFGFGKLTDHKEYSLTNRNAKGKTSINPVKAGNLVFAKFVNPTDELLIITAQGNTIRTQLDQVSVFSRNSKGVRIIKLNEGDKIISVEVIKN